MSRPLFFARSLTYLIAVPLSLTFAVFVGAPSAQAAPMAPAVAQAVPPTPQNQLVVAQGVVRDPDGKPLKGASVVALYLAPESQSRPQPVVQTDEQGRFTIEATLSAKIVADLRLELKMGEKDFPLIVLVHAPGYAVMSKALKGAPKKGANLPPNDARVARGFDAVGYVITTNGKSLAGVKVQADDMQLEGIEEDESPEGGLWFGEVDKESPFRKAFQATSDDTGRFTLHDLPRGSLNVGLADPRYVAQNINISVSDKPADAGQLPTLTATPGSSLRGRVLYPDGKPVVGVQVAVSNVESFTQMVATNMIGKDGTYSFPNIEAGKMVVSVVAPSAEWALTTSQPVELKAGMETKLDDLTLSQGVVVAGFVREKETKAPVAGAKVAAYTQGASDAIFATTDKQGRYQMRVQPGRYQFRVDDMPLDFLKSQEDEPKLTVVNETETAPEFLLHRGITLAGTAKDEKGQPATGAVISLANGGFDLDAKVDAQGNWTLPRIDPTRFYGGTEANTAKLRISGDWSLRGDTTVKLNGPPVALVLHHVQLQDVTVRAVTPQGRPVADATVNYKIFLTDTGDTWSDRTATTDAYGEAVLKGLRPETPVELTATKQGYTLEKQGKIARLGGTTDNADLLQAQDIVMSSLDAKVTGRVLDAQGQPAAGARVVLLSSNDLRDLPDESVLTDDKGLFTLEGLPQGELTLGVAKGHAYGQGVVQANSTLELKLDADAPVPPPQDSAAAFDQLERWLQAARADEGGAERRNEGIVAAAIRLAPYDADRAQRLMTDAQGNLNQDFLRNASVLWAHSDPQHALTWGRKVLPLTKDAAALTDAKLRLAALTATVDPAWARQVYEEVAGATTPTDLSVRAAYRYAQLAALAGALKNPDANGWLQALLLCMNAMTGQERRDTIVQSAGTLANGDVSIARQWAAQLSPPMQVFASSRLIDWGIKHNLPAAQQMAGDLDTLIQRPDFPPTKPHDDHTYEPSPAELLSAARTKIAATLLSSDLPTAQKFADALPPDVLLDGNLKLEIQARTARPQDEAVLKNALDVTHTQWWSAGNKAFIASLLSDALPQLSAQMFKDAREKLADRNDSAHDGEAGAAYAYARASYDPAESRLLLENEWLRVTALLRQAKKPEAKDQGTIWQAQSAADSIIKAMIPLSLERANAMIQESRALSDDETYSIRELRLRIIDWLLADAQTRCTTPLQHYTEDWEWDIAG